jgi:hypothetical protein
LILFNLAIPKKIALRKELRVVVMCYCLCLHFPDLIAQSLRYSASMPYISLGAYSTKQNDPFAFTNNQAALAQVKNAGMGVYGEQRFLLSENSVYGAAAVMPASLGNFGVQANYAGFKNFNENKIGLAYARSLGNKVDIGVQFNYYGYNIPSYGNASSVNFEIGAIMHFTEKLNGGIHVYNPVGGKMGKSGDEKLASAYKLGVGYDASDNFYASAELIKEEDKSINVAGGIQYQFLKQFFARAGFMTETGSGFAGFGIGFNNLRLDVSGSYHPQLGFSPGLMLIVNFKGSHQ